MLVLQYRNLQVVRSRVGSASSSIQCLDSDKACYLHVDIFSQTPDVHVHVTA